jgi:hypothetical protein
MAAHGGPNRVSDGMVFLIDAENQKKSNNGKPVSNLLRPTNNSLNIHHPSRRPFSGSAHGTNEISTDITPPFAGMTVYKLSDNGVDSQSVRYSLRFNASTFLEYNKKYTYSFWIYLPSEFAGRYVGHNRAISQNSTGTDWHNVRGFSSQHNYYGAGSIMGPLRRAPNVTLYDTWQRVAMVFEPLAENVNLSENTGNDNNVWVAGWFRIDVPSAVNGGTPYHVYLSDGQLEEGDILSDFVLEEKANNESLRSAVSNIAVTASSLEYLTNNDYKFNGTSSHIAVTTTENDDLDFRTAMSFDVWVYPESGAGLYIFAKNSNSGYADQQYACDFQSNRVGFVLAGNENLRSTASSVPTDQWTHIAGTWDGATQIIYINGVQNAQRAFSTEPIFKPNLVVGWRNNGLSTHYFKGRIPVLKFYNRALTSDEVQLNFQATRGRYGL